MWVRLTCDLFPTSRARLVGDSFYAIASTLIETVKHMVEQESDDNRLVNVRLPHTLLKKIQGHIKDGTFLSVNVEALIEEHYSSGDTQEYYIVIRVETLKPTNIPPEISELINTARYNLRYVPREEYEEAAKAIEAAEDYFRK
jgi:hypothetical protein